MGAWRYGIYLLMFKSISHSFTVLTHSILIWTLKDKFHIILHAPMHYSLCVEHKLKVRVWVYPVFARGGSRGFHLVWRQFSYKGIQNVCACHVPVRKNVLKWSVNYMKKHQQVYSFSFSHWNPLLLSWFFEKILFLILVNLSCKGGFGTPGTQNPRVHPWRAHFNYRMLVKTSWSCWPHDLAIILLATTHPVAS